MSDSKDETIRIRINSDMKKALEELSKKDGTPMSKLIREGIALELYIWADKTNFTLPQNIDKYVKEEIIEPYKNMVEDVRILEKRIEGYKNTFTRLRSEMEDLSNDMKRKSRK